MLQSRPFHSWEELVGFEVKLRSDPSSSRAILAFIGHNAWEGLIDGRRVLMSDDAGRLSLMGEASGSLSS